jgi:two-component system response regulator RegX3
MTGTKVLIVEDDDSIADALAFLVRNEGFTPSVASGGQQALEEFDCNGADIVLLDLALPDMSGTEVCRQLRYRSSVPVIVVSARDAEIDRVVGFEVGADDYVTKPYSSRELMLRIRAILRRGQGGGHSGDDRNSGRIAPGPEVRNGNSPAQSELSGGPVRIDLARHVVTVNGAEVHLPLKEFQLLEYLLRNPGRVLTRDQLIREIWGRDYCGDTKTLDVHVRRLRLKIEPEPGTPRYLVNVRGLGFKFDV